MRRLLTPLMLAAVLAGCGTESTTTAEDFQGAEREVAQVVEDLQDAGERKDAERICSEILARSVVQSLDEAGGSCTEEMERSIEDADDFQLEVEDVTVTGGTARATVRRDDGGEDTRTTFEFAREGNAWRATAFGS